MCLPFANAQLVYFEVISTFKSALSKCYADGSNLTVGHG